MAAMAPALTDAPADAHRRIHFKLAPPSSSIPSETSSAIATTTKRKSEESAVGRLQPLVASYLCSDVTALSSNKALSSIHTLLTQTHPHPPNGVAKRHDAAPAGQEDCPPPAPHPDSSPGLTPTASPGRELQHHGDPPAPQGQDRSLGLELSQRAQQSALRQGHMEGRVRGLRRRLEALQATHLERHLSQQIEGLLGRLGGGRGRTAGVGEELELLAGSGGATLRRAEAALDSDATDSSSGGDSQSEDELNGTHTPLLAAEHRWASDRVSIISHWSWLTAHISELEYRIRKHTEVYRQLRWTKGPVMLGDAASTDTSLVEREREAEHPGCQVTEENAMATDLRKGSVAGNQLNGLLNRDTEQQLPLLASDGGAARTRPLLSCKKRRLLRPRPLSLQRKVLRQQGVCEVNAECVMCVGRPCCASGTEMNYDRPLLVRLAQLDHSLHPVLSLADDVVIGLLLQRELRAEKMIGREKHQRRSSLPSSSSRNRQKLSRVIRRRRGGENSFDINSIIIPMATTSRLEKLQYKEIITPSWREVDVSSQPITAEEDTVEVEDLSDVAFTQLHQSCEDKERARYRWAAAAIAKRRGSRTYRQSLDGQTTPLQFSTAPSSPDSSHFHGLHDYSSSHFHSVHDYSSSPCSPASPDLTFSYGSAHQRLLSNEDTRSSTPENTYEDLVPQPVLPWEQRCFPLESDPVWEELPPSPRPSPSDDVTPHTSVAMATRPFHR
ncbi:KAT8 regulatory NSL complex subunit 1 [Aplochiton taeniatus]